jgi:AcrR family transcriptional regulator
VSASVFDPEIRGLPSGYSGLPRELVEASQLQRLRHGVIAAVADKGYGATTIAEIAARAGVSKKTFYEYFPDKPACFLAAYDHGSSALLAAVTAASVAAAEDGAEAIDQLRAGTGAYLDFLVTEASYTRVFFLEILSAGPEAIARQRACRAEFARSLRAWHERARSDHRDWPAASELAYEAATGAVHEVALGRVAVMRAKELPALEEELVGVQLDVLGVPRS